MLGKPKKHFITSLLAILFFGFALIVNLNLKKPEIIVDKQDSALNFNTYFIKLMAIGNKRLISDVLWVQTLLESDETQYKNNDLNSWMYLRFKNIAELDPEFYQNYLWGGMYLSIIKDDRLGAAEIFERGLKYYPNEYELNYHAGFNYYAQLQNYEKAYDLFNKIQTYPQAPMHLKTLTAKLHFQKSLDYDDTIEILIGLHDNTKDEVVKKRIYLNIYSLSAERDLNCLNLKKENCNKKDIQGDDYIFSEGKFKSQKAFAPYRIHQR